MAKPQLNVIIPRLKGLGVSPSDLARLEKIIAH
jgi:hypothetical protein